MEQKSETRMTARPDMKKTQLNQKQTSGLALHLIFRHLTVV